MADDAADVKPALLASSSPDIPWVYIKTGDCRRGRPQDLLPEYVGENREALKIFA